MMKVLKKWLRTTPSLAAAIRPPQGGASEKGLAGLKQVFRSPNGRNRPGPLHNLLKHPFWRKSAMAGLLCTSVVLTYALIGMIAYHLYSHFWFLVFLVLFTPVWLVCYGLLFATRWKWHELSAGVFVALFLISNVYLNSVEELSFRLLSSLSLAATGVIAVSLGFCATRLGLSVFGKTKRPGT
jgi:hypothetical protein